MADEARKVSFEIRRRGKIADGVIFLVYHLSFHEIKGLGLIPY